MLFFSSVLSAMSVDCHLVYCVTKQLKELTKGTFVPGTGSSFEELNWN